MKYKLTKRIVILLNIDDVGISDIDAYIDLTRQNLLDAFGQNSFVTCIPVRGQQTKIQIIYQISNTKKIKVIEGGINK